MSAKQIIKFSFTLLLVVVYLSCGKSFLTQDPVGTLDPTTLADEKGVGKILIGAYAMLDNYDPGIEFNQFGASASNSLFGEIGGTVANKGSDLSDQAGIYTPIERHETDALNQACFDQWNVNSEGIKRTNNVLNLLKHVQVISDESRTNIMAQARFLRAWYHFNARIIFKKFPYIDETTAAQLDSGTIKGVSNQEEIFPKIVEDAKFAYENLPESQDAVGRVNKWSAAAFYGKVLLYTQDYATARTVLNDVIEKGKNPLGVKYTLNTNYSDNFDNDHENSAESIFAFQASVQDNAGAGNSNWGDVLNTPPNAGGGAGFFTPTYYFVNRFKTDANGLPLANPNDKALIDLYGQGSAGYTQYVGNVDPRLDWTIGRNGIPYYDWGVVDHTWVRTDVGGSEPWSSGPFEPKKQSIKQSQVGEAHDGSIWFQGGGVSLNINLIRFADVILMAAEAEAMDPSGSVQKAWELVNMIRARAAATPTVKTYIDNSDPSGGFTNIDAGQYKTALYPTVFASRDAAMKAIQLERLLELGMEGLRFFDLVRWGIAGTEMNAFYQYESALPYAKLLRLPSVATYDSPGDDYYPVPQKEIDLGNGFITP